MLGFDDPFSGGAGYDASMYTDAYMFGGWSLPSGFSGQSQMGGNMSFDLGNIDLGQVGEDIETVADIFDGGGSGDARERAVAIVNSAERVLIQNYDDFKAGNISASSCAEKFDQIWAQVVTRLQALGSEGSRAIADRQAGGKWDWFSYYRPAGVRITPGTPSTGSLITSNVGSGLFSGGKIDAKTILLIGVIGFFIWYAAKQGAFNR